MTVGSVLRESWELYTRFFARFVLMAFLVYVVIDLIGALAASTGEDWAAVFWGLVAAVLSIIGFFWLAGALVRAVEDARDGRLETSVGELFARVRPRLPALIAAGILAGIGIGIGLILLIVPGLYLLTLWALIAPVIVLEGVRAGDSFGRSSDLTRGHRWAVLGVLLIVFVVSGIVRGIISGLLSFLPDFLHNWIGNLAADAVVNPFAAVAVTVMYFQLRGRQEAVEAEAVEPLEPAPPAP